MRIELSSSHVRTRTDNPQYPGIANSDSAPEKYDCPKIIFEINKISNKSLDLLVHSCQVCIIDYRLVYCVTN